MVAATPFSCCSQCAFSSRSISATSASSSVSRWIETSLRFNAVVMRVRAAPGAGARRFLSSSGCIAECGVSTGTSGVVVEAWDSHGASDGVESIQVQLGCQPWSILDGAKGWMLGLAVAFVLMAGESHAAMTVPRSPRTGYDPISEEEREASSAFARRVTDALELLEQGRKAQASEDFSEALRCYSLITQNSGDLALAEYARVGRALTLYEVGDRAEAIAEMEDMSLSLRGYPEVHAALAAALYADKHAPVPAEQQFTFATLLDRRYTDPSWVKSAKHWPPSLIVSLQRFIALK